ncbi:hypothetical protein Q3O98_06195 [Ralstonia pseudosolanacearum]|uniref:hypothetical protein n=1 Tax=Ralstonia pseudosolanacearum TaxID=1310165 RepID=UPI002674B5CC|nr:hypothetical protein [Ralstonia pseudosolanacearum]MDO3620680.1 hypothetical protein [Ralstonia pseudosolanacearum]
MLQEAADQHCGEERRLVLTDNSLAPECRAPSQTLQYFADGSLGPAIARELGPNLDTVCDCHKRWLQTGWEVVRNKKAGGASSKLERKGGGHRPPNMTRRNSL